MVFFFSSKLIVGPIGGLIFSQVSFQMDLVSWTKKVSTIYRQISNTLRNIERYNLNSFFFSLKKKMWMRKLQDLLHLVIQTLLRILEASSVWWKTMNCAFVFKSDKEFQRFCQHITCLLDIMWKVPFSSVESHNKQ